MTPLDHLRPIAKAITGALAAGAAAGATAAMDDTITAGEWWVIAASVLGALAAVWAVPNRAPQDDYQPRHAG